MRPYLGLIADEVNVKKVDLNRRRGRARPLRARRQRARRGPRLGKDVQTVIKAVKAGDWTETDGVVSAAGIDLLPSEYTQRLVAAEPESTAALPDGAGLVVLDSRVTEELEPRAGPRTASASAGRPPQRGTRRLRPHLGHAGGPGGPAGVGRSHREMIAGEILATSLELGAVSGDAVVDLGEGVRAVIVRPDRTRRPGRTTKFLSSARRSFQTWFPPTPPAAAGGSCTSTWTRSSRPSSN